MRAQEIVDNIRAQLVRWRDLNHHQIAELRRELVDRERQLAFRRGELHAVKSGYYEELIQPGREYNIVETTQSTETRVVSSTFTETYDKAFLRLVFDGEAARVLVGEGDDRTSSGVFYVDGIVPGEHTVQLQWNTPQFGGQTPTVSEKLVSLSNVVLQLKEIRYRLIQDVS